LGQELLDLEDEGTTNLWNIRNRSPCDTVAPCDTASCVTAAPCDTASCVAS